MIYQAYRQFGKVTSIQRINDDGSLMSIPLDPANMDYQEFVKWEKTNGFLDLSDQPFTPSQNDLDALAARTDIQTQYQVAVNRLGQIIGNNNPNNSQMIAAVQDLATIQLRILKLLRWLA
jgi:hypothetical protein